MLFMIIEDLSRGGPDAVSDRFQRQGRMMPDGLHYVSSWIDPEHQRCFQLMETHDPALLGEWVSAWADLINFEIVPVLPSAEYWEERGRP